MKLAIKSVMTVSLIALVLATLLLAACNTTKGAGKDIEAAGSGIKHSAERNGAD